MEDKLRVEAKNLVEQIKARRNKLEGSRDTDEFVLQGESASQAPKLLSEPKRRKLLKGHFGKVCLTSMSYQRNISWVIGSLS